MAKLKLRGKDLRDIGYPQTKAISLALDAMEKHYKKETKPKALATLKDVLTYPDNYLAHDAFAKVAQALLESTQDESRALNTERAPFKIYGEDQIEQGAKDQLYTALTLPVSRKGALMPDGHQGYGLPIGGVLATENAVIPYGVGVDIGCRMCLSIYDIAPNYLEGHKDKYIKVLQEHTKFGPNEVQKKPSAHDIFDREEFRTIPVVKRLRERAVQQLGSSGGGNHFVEFGLVEITEKDNDFNVPPGNYVGVLSHSGSRGLGANVAKHFTDLAMKQTPLPKEARHLGWLGLDTQEGQEYWLAMNLAGDYASACHHDIHNRIASALGERPLAIIENHHNFAWKEMVNGQELIVHRKGATPAGKNVMGIIPGSMTAPGYIVKGLGNEQSMNSASHGAGRQMSRTAAKRTITHSELRKTLADYGVTLLGAGLDEAPMAYKDIIKVMAEQTDLVSISGTFLPKIVRMDKG
jgi:tRNA-splicing ligase RtcB (3'-phosphate/5'-hydroxy nucleic acid ligase)